MNLQIGGVGNQLLGLSLEDRMNPLEMMKKSRQLDSAVRHGQTEIIDLLLDQTSLINSDPDGLYWDKLMKFGNPLHSSVYLGDQTVVEKLLRYGASTNSWYYGNTPLTLAAKFGKINIVDTLLMADGLENCHSCENITHLHIACMRNQINIAKRLLQSKQDLDASVDYHSDYWPGFTALHFAVQYQHIKLVKFLLSVGADITVKDARSFTPLHLAHMLRNEIIIDMILTAHKGVLQNPADSKGLTHFHIACTRNDPSIVEYFIKLGVDVESKLSKHSFCWKNKTALDLAIHYGSTHVVKVLIRYGARLPFFERMPYEDREFQRIKDAFSTGNKGIVRLISRENTLTSTPIHTDGTINLIPLFTGFDLDIAIENLITQKPSILYSPIISIGCTLLHVVFQYPIYTETIIMILLKLGADYTIQDSRGKSPLHLAFERHVHYVRGGFGLGIDMKNVVNLMLESHVKFSKNPVDKDGLSHLHIACAMNNPTIVEHLLRHGANINSHVNLNAVSWRGFTPLHFAAEFLCLETVQILLQHDANYSIVDASNSSAFDVAINRKFGVERERIMKLILKHHSRHKKLTFNDRGYSALHLVGRSYGMNNVSTCKKITKILNAYPNDVNKAINKMNFEYDGYTPLHFAVDYDNMNLARLLLSKGADIFKQATNGDTPLHCLSPTNPTNDILFDEIAPQDSRLLQSNFLGGDGQSIFHKACATGSIKTMKYFLEHGVSPNCFSLEVDIGCINCAPIHLVIWYDSDSCVDAVKLLLEYGADPNVKDFKNNTPLHYMTKNRHSEIIDLLVNYGADVEARNFLLETPLLSLCYFTAGYVNENLVRLLHNGANINSADADGLTPISVFDSFEIHYPPDTIKTLFEHLNKLFFLGSHISEINIKAHNSLGLRFADEFEFIRSIDFQIQCFEEIDLMKETYTDDYTTLHDVLFEHPNKLAVICQNKVFQRILNSNHFQELYPKYGFLLKLRLKQGQIRRPLLENCLEAFVPLLGITLPQACAEGILKYLDNRDLKNIILSLKRNK
ncbi:hypothetical protein QAD02_009694 [Eretmocerus hayati]|uniref:Uncharacterized protein n=1 Tax=Eretmocerus hayati TaxID=131215 RepID=A0ACC2NAF4_9HYME|nr:hypothetical protein QAD02_009694 [Eretmocerus hayati]